jgi:methylenetetrahydrofolate reductase (NADPH)
MPSTTIDKHFVELVAPRQDTQYLENDFRKFNERYRLFLDNDMVICITDNPMGHLSFMGPEIIDTLELPVKTDNIMVHLNTFHRKTDEKYDPAREQNEQDLDILLQHTHQLGIKYLLCVSGDGSERLPRLQPQALGYPPESTQTITSVQLLEHIHKEYSGQFTCGAAFNHYEPTRDEMEKLERKLGAGASFIITQPVAVDGESDARIAAANKNLEDMLKFADTNNIQVILEAWMSQKLAHLMPECVGHDIHFGNFDPWANLKAIRDRYPERKLYLSMIFGPKTLLQVQELLLTA